MNNHQTEEISQQIFFEEITKLIDQKAKDKIKSKEKYEANKQYFIDKAQRWYRQNKEYAIEKIRELQDKKKEQIKTYRKAYYEKNKEKLRKIAVDRYHNKKMNPSTYGDNGSQSNEMADGQLC